MGINARSSMHPAWTRHNTPVVVGFMLATIKVVRKLPNDGALKYNKVTGEYTNQQFTTVLESVQARVQPFGIIGDMVVGQDTTSRRLMRVQIENVETDINVDDQITVTYCKANPDLAGFQMEVRGTITSSNAWLTDIVAEADNKWTS